jgi:hypothetical protein
MCQSANCCITCCAPTKGRGGWVLLAIALAIALAAAALVSAWAWVAVKVDAALLLRPAHIRPVDMPVLVASWWSPTLRHLLAAKVVHGQVVLPASPGVIQATMALLALVPAALVLWVRCGCPLPTKATSKARVAAAAAPSAPARVVIVRRLPAGLPVAPWLRRPALPRREVGATAALPPGAPGAPGTSTAAKAGVLPAPQSPPTTRFIRLAHPAPAPRPGRDRWPPARHSTCPPCLTCPPGTDPRMPRV